MTFALFVTDPELYAQYRSEIAPLLASTGGSFKYDFEVSRVLKSEVQHAINRLFVLRFPDRASKERFFGNATYQEIRTRLFEKAVRGMTIISE